MNKNLSCDLNAKVKFSAATTIKRVVGVFSREKFFQGKNFSLAIIGPAEMKKINWQYRGKDKVTDVLSFAEMDSELGGVEDGGYLGEILICWSQVQRQAKEFGCSAQQEFVRMLVHGLAHLAGYDHEGVSQRAAAAMRRFEEKILLQIR